MLVAKAQAALARRVQPPHPSSRPSPAAAPTGGWPRPGRRPRRLPPPLVAVVLLAVAGGLAFSLLHRPARGRGPSVASPAAGPGAPALEPPDGDAETFTAELPPLPPLSPHSATPPPPPPAGAFGDGEDARAASALAGRLASGARLEPADLATAEQLDARYPGVGRRLLVSVLAALARQEGAIRRYEEAARLLERIVSLEPSSVEARRGLLDARAAQGDWPAVEAVALELQRLGAADADTVAALAYALVRQDRSREAIDLLTRELERGRDPRLAALLARLQRDASPEANLRQQTLSHFHVRYDGDAHEDVGRELLRVLERHYATLVSALDHEPAAPIPVVLLSREAYYDGTGAPAWSGGRFDSFDGRVRIPIGGLTTSLTPDLDDTALHELTHAFVSDRSRGLAPRELQEGLAQLMEGKRLGSLPDERLRALASGRAGGVGGYYLLSLAFVEDLVAQRGQGGINDVLATMGRTGNVDAAFRETYGQGYQETIAAAMTRLRQRHGG